MDDLSVLKIAKTRTVGSYGAAMCYSADFERQLLHLELFVCLSVFD